jgi:hypothetical protein
MEYPFGTFVSKEKDNKGNNGLNFGKRRNEIKEIDVSNHDLSGELNIKISSAFDLTNLEKFNLSSNKVTNLTLDNLNNLQSLDCSNNQLIQLINLNNLPKLKDLNISNNNHVTLILNNCKLIDKKKYENNPLITLVSTKKNLGIVGFSYEVTSKDSKKPLVYDGNNAHFGNTKGIKVQIAHGENCSDDYDQGYGYSYIFLGDTGPFYSIIGGSTFFTTNDYKGHYTKYRKDISLIDALINSYKKDVEDYIDPAALT